MRGVRGKAVWVSVFVVAFIVVSVRGLAMNPDLELGVGEVIEVKPENRMKLGAKGPKEECHIQEAFLARHFVREARSTT